MTTNEVEECITVLQNKLNVALETNRSLEKENDLLKQEVVLLKSRIASSRLQEAEKRSVIWGSNIQEKQKAHGNIVGILPKADFLQPPSPLPLPTAKERPTRVPNPLPIPLSDVLKPKVPATPRPPTDSLKPKVSAYRSWLPPPPPPPPPPPAKLQGSSSMNVVRRVPEVVELYRALTRKKEKPEMRTIIPGAAIVTNCKEMIGEIENRSAYLLAIKSDVETQAEFIDFLTKQVEDAAYSDITDLEAFVKWLDGELSYLIDERAVLKHFPKWPERKADAMREAAFSYRDLKSLELQVSSFHDDMRQVTSVALKQLLALQEKLETSVHGLERVRESAIKRYRDFQIPWEWMLDSGIIFKLKSSSLKLAKRYMNRVITSFTSDASPENGDLVFQGVCFAFRVHQFVGGFNEDCRKTFHELQKLAGNYLP